MTVPAETERLRPAELVSGFLSAAAIFVSLMGLAYRPVRLIPFAILLALVSAAIGGRNAKLAAFAALMSPETTSSRSTESPVERWIWPFTWSVAGPTMRSVEPSAETREMFSRKGERKGSWISSKL